MAQQIKCPKCNGVMTTGYVIDRDHGGMRQEQIWVEGEPEPSFWSGLKTSNRDVFKVQAFRCANCNFLEFYTTEKMSF